MSVPPAVNVLNTRRSFTLPARANRPPPIPPSATAGNAIETLFICNSSKIVSFTATGPTATSTAVQSAAWTTPTERTLAVGRHHALIPTTYPLHLP